MFFSFYSKDMNFKGELLYIRNENSLCYKPFNTNKGVGIKAGGYTELDIIHETSEVIHLSGFSPKNVWIKEDMTIPRAKRGCLWVHFDSPPMKGVCIEFASNIIAVLRGGDLVAVWAKIKEAV
jgi:hypothetical protein